MQPDWYTLKHSGGGPEDKGGEIVGLAPVKCKAVKEEEKLRRRAKKANRAKGRQRKGKMKQKKVQTERLICGGG